MTCGKCGKEVSDGAKFCGTCGAFIQQEKIVMVCPKCGFRTQEDMWYCEECGTLLREEQGTATASTGKNTLVEDWAGKLKNTVLNKEKSGADKTTVNEEKADNSKSAVQERYNNMIGRGSLLKECKGYSLYKGRPVAGIAKATGILRIYDDRIEYEKILGSSGLNMFGLVGMAASRKSAKKDSVLSYYFYDIDKIETGKYAGIYNTLVVVTNYGETVSFCPAIPGSSQPEEIVNLIKLYMN